MDVVNRKRSREVLENDEEKTETILSLLSFLMIVIGAWYHDRYFVKEIPKSYDKRVHQMQLWMISLSRNSTCFTQLRVNVRTFNRLCDLLCKEGGLIASRHVTIQEIVALFLHVLGHDQKNSTTSTTFVRSGETISRQFHIVLRAILKIGKFYLRQKSDAESWRWFPNAVGALDGTYVHLTVPAEDRSRYRNMKGFISTNVLGVCDANLKFIYALPRWEGSASDARVLRDALQRPSGLKVSRDQYFLVDAGYTNGPRFLAPYRGTRYHLNEWRGNTPRNYKELFNLRHSSVRNAIERAFGLLKKRWAILRNASFYDVKTQIRIINACFILHNFVRDEMSVDPLLVEVDRELAEQDTIEDNDSSVEEQIRVVKTTVEWTAFQDNLAKQMFEEYQARRA